MIELSLGAKDLARVRLAMSPVWELMTSVRVLQDRSRRRAHAGWWSIPTSDLSGVRMDWLLALMPLGRYVPDFLTPTPTVFESLLEDELEIVANTDASLVRAELELLAGGAPIPSPVRALYEDPARYLPDLVAEMDKYWNVAIKPVWSKIQGVNQDDFRFRMDQSLKGASARFCHT